MNTNMLIGAVAVVVIVGGVWLFSSSGGGESDKIALDKNGADKMMMEDDKMMGDDAMMEGDDAMMEGDDAMMEGDDAMMEGDDAMMMEVGTYELYDPAKLANANTGDVVLFFRADWCPTCQATDKNLKENASTIPAGLTILNVNYDDNKDLRTKYAVTTQHTFVQVDAQGNEITKWVGSDSAEDIASKVQ